MSGEVAATGISAGYVVAGTPTPCRRACATLGANRRLLVPASPGDPVALDAWLRSPHAPRPVGPTVAAVISLSAAVILTSAVRR